MHSRFVKIGFAILVCAMAIPLFLSAEEPGKIKGIIVDKDTSKPISGASVQIEGTTLGALTGPDGDFLIMLVPPGTYKLKITAIGYTTVIYENLIVTSSLTSECPRIEMIPASTDLDKVIRGEAKRDKIEKYVTASSQSISADQIKCMPVQTVGDIAAIKKGNARCAETSGYFPPAHGGTAIVNGEAFDAMFYENYGVNPFVDTEDDHLSTFAIDVDDASYVLTRSYIERGTIPPKDAVRTEEFINHFDYGYDPPANSPFEVYIEGAPSKFGQNCTLIRFGIKGKKIRTENRKAANLVFVVDVSGSMAREDRLGLVRQALRMLTNELTIRDKVGIVVYGSRGQVILEPTGIDKKEVILAAIEQLYPSGSTNAEEGLRLGYQMADRMFDPAKINRIILCSDGVANNGVTKAEELLKWIKSYADKGITLSSIGFGMGNYNDVLLEKLGNKGNGFYAYVDDIAEARRIFVENLTGTLQVIARDVKIQVDFDSSVVRSYRLLGYENRDVADDKFRDDKEDGGEIGSGHSVTALYEIKFHDNVNSDKLGTIFIRFKDPDNGEVTEVSRHVTRGMLHDGFAKSSPSFKLAAAAAEFGEILRKSYWARGSKIQDVLDLANEIYRERNDESMLEFMDLVSKAKQYEEQLADK